MVEKKPAPKPAPKKHVKFANTVGKPLTNVREIERVGKSRKIKQNPRKFVPADMKKLKAKHEAATIRAAASVSRAQDNLNQAKKIAANVQKVRDEAKLKMMKEKNPSMILYTKEKINKMNNIKKNLAPKLEMLQMDLNLKKDKLKAQRNIGMKRSRFTIL